MSGNINKLLAENLAHYMGAKGLKQQALATKCRVAQTTISNYLHPDQRKTGINGKTPSAKLTELEMLADALGVQPWKLLLPLTGDERKAFDAIEAAYVALHPEKKASQVPAKPRKVA